MCKVSEKDLFDKRFTLVWEHFKFHAEQRTRMFHYFLIAVGLLLNAVSWMLRTDTQSQNVIVILGIGGVLSIIFLALDVRNTQLLKQSEDLLCLIENDLFKGWVIETPDNKTIKGGILSREAVLKKHIRKKKPNKNMLCFAPLFVDNIKHKTAIRCVEFLAAVGFWCAAIRMALPENCALNAQSIWAAGWPLIIGGFVSLGWGIYALMRPSIDTKWEIEAYALPGPNEEP